jgi:hypothetical protein
MKDEEAQTPEEEVKPSKVVPYHVAHAQLGHCGEDATRAVAAHLDWKIARGTASPCISCAEVKVKKKTFKQDGAKFRSFWQGINAPHHSFRWHR